MNKYSLNTKKYKLINNEQLALTFSMTYMALCVAALRISLFLKSNLSFQKKIIAFGKFAYNFKSTSVSFLVDSF